MKKREKNHLFRLSIVVKQKCHVLPIPELERGDGSSGVPHDVVIVSHHPAVLLAPDVRCGTGHQVGAAAFVHTAAADFLRGLGRVEHGPEVGTVPSLAVVARVSGVEAPQLGPPHAHQVRSRQLDDVRLLAKVKSPV